AALIDFMVYRHYLPRGESAERLLAFVVTSKTIRRIELGDVEPIQKAVDRFLTQLRRTQPAKDDGDPAVALRNAVWTPLQESLRGAELVLISPDGPLCSLPFPALPSAEGKEYLLEEIALAVIPVPQMLPEFLAPRGNRPEDRPPSLLAMGNIDFDHGLGAAAPKTPAGEGAAPAWKRRRAGARLQWENLPGTAGEVLALEDAFRKAVPRGKATVLREAQATSAAFRKEAPAHEYLHLATHGFFAPPDAGQESPGRRSGLGADVRASSAGYHPGVFSGLVLAGANKPRDDDDGILTALEVAELPLANVELAVLSACETGLGETAGGEGTLGLQRAFQLAGARTTITSLWKVDDDATRRLMEQFYENYWRKGHGALESLRRAQLWMLNEGPNRGIVRVDDGAKEPRRSPPYYWAAFVLAGDWR
ncbi:MAG: CHAT domain-containing protein, partial [Planctomycetota bacterium]